MDTDWTSNSLQNQKLFTALRYYQNQPVLPFPPMTFCYGFPWNKTKTEEIGLNPKSLAFLQAIFLYLNKSSIVTDLMFEEHQKSYLNWISGQKAKIFLMANGFLNVTKLFEFLINDCEGIFIACNKGFETTSCCSSAKISQTIYGYCHTLRTPDSISQNTPGKKK